MDARVRLVGRVFRNGGSAGFLPFSSLVATLTILVTKNLRLTLANDQGVDFEQPRRATLALAAR
jgi:hypothetical protein